MNITAYEQECKAYLLNRHISQENITYSEEWWIITYIQNEIVFAMKDLNEDNIGYQRRLIKPVNWNKSIAKFGSKIGYFYTDIDYKKPIIITEWEIDWISICHLGNVVWLQWIQQLSGLIEWLLDRWAHTIYLLVDRDHSAENAISKILSMRKDHMKKIFDVGSILSWHKDVNELISAWWVISPDSIQTHAKSIYDYFQWLTSFMSWTEKGWYKLYNHLALAEYYAKKWEIATYNWAIRQFNWYIWEKLQLDILEQKIIVETQKLLGWILLKPLNQRDFREIKENLLQISVDEKLWKKMNPAQNYEDNEIDITTYDINFTDRIYNPLSKTFRDYNKEDYKLHQFKYHSSILWDIENATNILDDFFNSILVWYNPEIQKWIQKFICEYAWYSLTEATNLQKSILLFWSGWNGKGTLLKIIENVIWSTTLVSHVPMKDMGDAIYQYELIGKVSNFDYDMSHNTIIDDSWIKKLVSWEPISVKAHYRMPFTMKPYAKFWTCSNTLPKIKDINESIIRRFVFIEFKGNFKIPKHDLAKDILKDKEKIFVLFIKSLEVLLARGSFDIPEEIENVVKNFVEDSDSVSWYIKSWSVILWDIDMWTHTSELYKDYQRFCSLDWAKPIDIEVFWREMVKKWFKKWKEKWLRCYYGISINEDNSEF